MSAYDPNKIEEKRLALLADPSLAPHGSASTYSNWKCRCDECRAAWAVSCDKRRKTRKALAEAGKIEVPHGQHGYTNYACRCAICTAAHTQARLTWERNRAT